MTESCSRLTGSLDKVSWYTVPGSFFVPMEGDQVVAYWSRSNNRIVIGERFILNGAVVRHEMLHALEGHSGHPQADFLDKCGRVVLCSDGCVAEGGPRGTFPLEDLYDLRTVKKAPSILSP